MYNALTRAEKHAFGAILRTELNLAAVQGMEVFTKNVRVPQTIAWVDSELWASLVDVLRTEAVALFFIRV